MLDSFFDYLASRTFWFWFSQFWIIVLVTAWTIRDVRKKRAKKLEEDVNSG